MQPQLFEESSGQLMLYEGGGKEYPKKDRHNWIYKYIQQTQMTRLAEGLKEIDYENLFANGGKNCIYFVANKIANKSVRTHFGLDRTYRKKEMNTAMLRYRQMVMEDIIAGLIAKAKGKIKHISPLIYGNLVARVVESKEAGN